jgi:hypothetical protein
MILNKLNPESRRLAEQLIDRFPLITEHIEVYIPVSVLDTESDEGSLYMDIPFSLESGLERITIHHRGNFFEIGCYYNGSKLSEEFLFFIISESDIDLASSIVNFVEQIIQLPPDSLKTNKTIRSILKK